MEEMTREEKFYDLLYDAGYLSIRQFAQAVDIDPSNICKNLHGAKNNTIQLNRLFKFAKVLKVSMDVLLELFYPEEMREIADIIEENENE